MPLEEECSDYRLSTIDIHALSSSLFSHLSHRSFVVCRLSFVAAHSSQLIAPFNLVGSQILTRSSSTVADKDKDKKSMSSSVSTLLFSSWRTACFCWVWVLYCGALLSNLQPPISSWFFVFTVTPERASCHQTFGARACSSSRLAITSLRWGSYPSHPTPIPTAAVPLMLK